MWEQGKYKIGDIVSVIPDRPFCTGGKSEIKGIKTMYDETTGEPYRVIVIEGGQEFFADSGYARTTPWAYSIVGEEELTRKNRKTWVKNTFGTENAELRNLNGVDV